MDINRILSYLKEELRDIPAKPDNVHLTDFEGLYYILQSGLKGQKGGYTIHSPKTKEDDMELATTRNTHKLSYKEKAALSQGAEGGVRINLFTDRIMSGHRGTRKDKIAELPLQRKVYMDNDQKLFKKRYGFEMPDLTVGPDHKLPENFNRKYVKDWLERRKYPDIEIGEIEDIFHYNHSIQEYYNELREREREERFILKKNIPVNPDYMSIVIEKEPEDIGYSDNEFCEETAKNYLRLIDKHEDVFLQNRNFRLFKNYLRRKTL